MPGPWHLAGCRGAAAADGVDPSRGGIRERRRQEQESIERRRREAIEASGRGWEEEDGLRFLARALRRLLR